MEVRMRLNNGQNNYQMPISQQNFDSIRKDPKFDDLMMQINQKNEQRDMENYQAQMSQAHAAPDHHQ